MLEVSSKWPGWTRKGIPGGCEARMGGDGLRLGPGWRQRTMAVKRVGLDVDVEGDSAQHLAHTDVPGNCGEAGAGRVKRARKGSE